MNPRERWLAAMRGEEVDRVPIHLPGFPLRSREAIAEEGDPFKARIAERVYDETHFEVGVSSQINRMLVTPPQRISSERATLPGGCTQTRIEIDTPRGPLTAETRFNPRLQTGWQVKYPVETVEDIEKIASVPWEIPVDLEPPSIASLPDGFDERGVLVTRISSPFVCVAAMMSYQQFLAMTASDPELVEELTEICRQRVLDCVEVLLSKPGIEVVWMGGSEWVTPPMGSPALYDALVQEQERSVIDYVHSHSDAVVHIHCHGSVRDALPKTIERGADYTEPVEPPPDGDITMAEAKRVADGRITLGGNLEARVLCNESEDRVEEATRAAFEGDNRRFVLRTSEGPSPRMAEREYRNYTRMIDVWEELSTGR